MQVMVSLQHPKGQMGVARLVKIFLLQAGRVSQRYRHDIQAMHHSPAPPDSVRDCIRHSVMEPTAPSAHTPRLTTHPHATLSSHRGLANYFPTETQRYHPFPSQARPALLLQLPPLLVPAY